MRTNSGSSKFFCFSLPVSVCRLIEKERYKNAKQKQTYKTKKKNSKDEKKQKATQH